MRFDVPVGQGYAPGTKQRRTWPWIVAILAFLFLVIAAVVMAIVIPPMLRATNNDNRPLPTPTRSVNATTPTPEATPATSPDVAEDDVPDDEDEVRSQLTKIEEQWTEANVKGDKEALEGILAEEYVGGATSHTKREYIDKLTPDPSIKSWELQDLKVDPASVPWVPSNGAAPGLQDLVAGGVEIVPCSLPEARSLIDAGKVKSLAVMADQPAALYPNVPTLKAATGSTWTMAAWRGIAAPKNIPAEARDKLVAAIRKIVAGKEYNEFMTQRGFGVIYAGPDDYAKFMAKSDTDLGATMKAVGIVK